MSDTESAATRRCTWCGEEKPKRRFCQGNKQGYHSWCYECRASRKMELKRDREAIRATAVTPLYFRQCVACKLFKPQRAEFQQHQTPDGRIRYHPACRTCRCERRREWYEKRRQQIATRAAENRWNRRMEIINGYGGKCVCCGETTPQFLTIDHIYGGGNQHRKQLGGTAAVYKQLKDQGFPRDQYRLLCYNCNCAIGHLGFCPHQQQRG